MSIIKFKIFKTKEYILFSADAQSYKIYQTDNQLGIFLS